MSDVTEGGIFVGVHFDVIIVGAGSMGMPAGYFLARRGVKTLLVDAYDPPHTQGSHHGETRIIRHAYGEGKEYVPLALRAQTLWDALQRETNETIFKQTGVLGFGPDSSAFIDEAIASAEEYDLTLEVLLADDISGRWPGVTVPTDFKGCYEPASGVLFSENAVRAYRNLALKHGATLLTQTPVRDLEIHRDYVRIHTEKGPYTADKLIMSSGAWSGKWLAKTGLHLPLQPRRQTVGWFQADEALYKDSVFPAFFVETGAAVFYGFPSFDACGLKLGRHDDGQATDPDRINREFGIYPEDEGDIRRFLEEFMPQAAGRLVRGRVCLYTKTPDDHFIVDLHPEYAHVVIAAGFSGHGFKFASVIGEVLSQLATDGKTAHDISPFAITRPTLSRHL